MKIMNDLPILYNGQALPLDDIPELSLPEFREAILQGSAHGWRVSALFGHAPEAPSGYLGGSPTPPPVDLYAVLADDVNGRLHPFRAVLEETSYPALTPDCPQVHLFEREIAEQFQVVPEGHPWLKPVRRPPHLTAYYRIEGEEIHEVAVGPVHAGVIEPGHFRFQCNGEHVFHLEIALGYQHRGVERALLGGPSKRTIFEIETLAGDTSIGHAIAYCQALESLTGLQVPLRGQALRAIALELERLANHTGDLGALANDVGYLPTASYCGRLRGDFLNATAVICGNRFGRGLIRPGCVTCDVDTDRANTLRQRLEPALRDVDGAAALLWRSASVLARFEDTGAVSKEDARAIGLVGPAARACGLEQDIRQDFPWGLYRFAHIPVSACPTGDVFARAFVRALEIQRSGAFVLEQLKNMAPGPIRGASFSPDAMKPRSLAVSLVEGWRGEICHVALTDAQGRFARYKVVDPSFHNWYGLGLSLRDQQISDFPLCNKSFNLSYCGFDL